MSVRSLGLAAIAGGALRILDSFGALIFPAGSLSVLYFATDIFLLLGALGIYLHRKSAQGAALAIGCAIFAAGIVMVRVSAAGFLGNEGYQAAAAVALIGLAIVSFESLARGKGERVSAVLWLFALTFGVAGAFGVLSESMTVAAGIAFGSGFVAAGWRVFAAEKKEPRQVARLFARSSSDKLSG